MGSTPSPDRPRGESTPLVVGTMIVRNESAKLGGFPTSLTDLVDQIVACDTDSRDDTVAIAESFGATAVRHQWNDDFAAARNVALAACGSPDRVLWIDADERLEFSDPEWSRGTDANIDRLQENWAGKVIRTSRSIAPATLAPTPTASTFERVGSPRLVADRIKNRPHWTGPGR